MDTLLTNLSLTEQIDRIVEARVNHQLNLYLVPLRLEAENAKTKNAQLQRDLHELKEIARANTIATTAHLTRVEQYVTVQGNIVTGIEEQKQMLTDMYHMTIQQQLQEQQHSSDIQEPENQIKQSTIIRGNTPTKPPKPQDTTIQTSTQNSLAQKTANTEQNIGDDDKKMQESRMNTQETPTKNTTKQTNNDWLHSTTIPHTRRQGETPRTTGRQEHIGHKNCSQSNTPPNITFIGIRSLITTFTHTPTGTSSRHTHDQENRKETNNPFIP